MFKSIMVTVPPKTPEVVPVSTEVVLCKGVLTHVCIRPPPGPNWEVFGKIRYRETSIIPGDELEWIPLERYPVDVYPNWEEWDGTYTFDVLFCSPDARFSHTIVVEFEIDEKTTITGLLMDLISRGL